MALGVHTLGTNIPKVPIRYATHLRCVHIRQAAHPETPTSEAATPKHPQTPDANTPSRSKHTSVESHVPKRSHRDLGKGEGRRADAPRATPPSVPRDRAFPFLVLSPEPPGNLHLFLSSKQEVAPRMAAASGLGRR